MLQTTYNAPIPIFVGAGAFPPAGFPRDPIRLLLRMSAHLSFALADLECIPVTFRDDRWRCERFGIANALIVIEGLAWEIFINRGENGQKDT